LNPARPDPAALSVCVLACNEADRLERCLLAAKPIADEIIVVVDARSRDRSEEVARRLASRVEVRPYAGDLEQKRGCVSLAKNDWVLVLDPDEVVSTALAKAIEGALDSTSPASRTEPVGYRLNRATYHLGRWIRHGDFFPDWKLRLFRVSRARWTGRDPHARIEVEGPVADLEPVLAHYSYRDLADQIERIQFFSGEAASALAAEGQPFRLSRLLLHPPARFVRGYVLKQGFRDGLPGFIIAAASSFYVFLKYAKHWERMRASGQSGPSEPG
jgi:hypothetical protein